MEHGEDENTADGLEIPIGKHAHSEAVSIGIPGLFVLYPEIIFSRINYDCQCEARFGLESTKLQPGGWLQ